MATKEVLSNRDLVRNLIAQSTKGSHLLAANKAIRDAQQPCTTHFERWSEVGCPAQPQSDEERDLSSVTRWTRQRLLRAPLTTLPSTMASP